MLYSCTLVRVGLVDVLPGQGWDQGHGRGAKARLESEPIGSRKIPGSHADVEFSPFQHCPVMAGAAGLCAAHAPPSGEQVLQCPQLELCILGPGGQEFLSLVLLCGEEGSWGLKEGGSWLGHLHLDGAVRTPCGHPGEVGSAET